MTTNTGQLDQAPLVFQSAYGAFRSGFLWLLPLPAMVGLIGVPAGIFYNEGWEMNGHPLAPWSATVIIEIFSVGALATVVATVIRNRLRRKSPHRVAVTESSLIVPKGMFSNDELVMPLSEIHFAVFSMGFVKQLQIKHQRRKVLLSSAMFPAADDFERLLSCLDL